MKLGLGHFGTNLNHTTGTHITQYESSYIMVSELEGVFVKDSLSQAEKRNLIKKHKPRKTPFICDYCKMIGHYLSLCEYLLKSYFTLRVITLLIPCVKSNAIIRSWPCIFSSIPYQGAHGYLSLKREGQIPFTISNIQAMTRK
ncbi:hypothetical protein M9H77_34624 [Catharanthus roseus]|uniref:Uncharacterized protein n=1 Tax=Catharanthus roseus TaxID=4058 RepID=A0ACB9ZLQ1_CATRO|nr:hypothetical protein M9H77_34624 [Catharanthus roseus]